MRVFLTLVILTYIISIAFAACSASDNEPGEKAEIPESAMTITFDGGTQGPVEFSHEIHSTEYYDGICLFCHDHEDVSGETHWYCRDCHSVGQDIEGLCEEVDEDHGCIMTQCQNCHILEGPPAPDGSSCNVVAGGCHL